jgi:hypothetical protein
MHSERCKFSPAAAAGPSGRVVRCGGKTSIVWERPAGVRHRCFACSPLVRPQWPLLTPRAWLRCRRAAQQRLSRLGSCEMAGT